MSARFVRKQELQTDAALVKDNLRLSFDTKYDREPAPFGMDTVEKKLQEGSRVGALVGATEGVACSKARLAVGNPLHGDSGRRVVSQMKRCGTVPSKKAAKVWFTNTKLHVKSPPS